MARSKSQMCAPKSMTAGPSKPIQCGDGGWSKFVCTRVYQAPIPLLSFSDSGDSIELSIVEAVPWREYVAISHVWSDGLGNHEKNAFHPLLLFLLHLTHHQGRHTYYTVSYLDKSIPNRKAERMQTKKSLSSPSSPFRSLPAEGLLE
jgi:hypothetical protein